MTLYHVGDEVIIRSDLRPGYGLYPMANKINGYYFVPDMEKYRGKHAIIDHIPPNETYYSLSVDNGRWMWTDSMLEDALGNEEIYLVSDEEFNEFLGLHAIK